MKAEKSVRKESVLVRGKPCGSEKETCPVVTYIAEKMAGNVSDAVAEKVISAENARKTLKVIEGFWEEECAEDAAFFLEGLLVCISAEESLIGIKIVDECGTADDEIYNDLIGKFLCSKEIRKLMEPELVCTISSDGSEGGAYLQEESYGML